MKPSERITELANELSLLEYHDEQKKNDKERETYPWWPKNDEQAKEFWRIASLPKAIVKYLDELALTKTP